MPDGLGDALSSMGGDLSDAPVPSDVVLLLSDIDGGPEPDGDKTGGNGDVGSGILVVSAGEPGLGLPHSRHDVSLPSGPLLGVLDCAAGLRAVGPDATLEEPRCDGIGRPRPTRPRLSRRMTLPRLPPPPRDMVGHAVTVLIPIPAVAAPRGLRVSWLGRALSVWMSMPLDSDIMDS